MHLLYISGGAKGGQMNIINQLYNLAIQLFNDKKYIKLSLLLLGIILSAVCTGFVLYMIISLIVTHLIEIVTTIGGIIIFFSVLINFFSKKNTEVEPVTSVMDYDPIVLESTYSLIRKNLAVIISDISEIIKLKKPATVMQMDAPSHYDIVGNVPIYHYMFFKLTEKADIDVIMGVLQTTITQTLESNSFEGITQSRFLYNSASYPSILVDNVIDTGSFIQVDIAIASEAYCRHRKQRIYNAINSGNVHSNVSDKDF